MFFVSVRELVDAVDKSLVLELYSRNEDKKLDHRGTFNLDVENSREELLSSYGNAMVKHKDVYKAYVLVYLA